MKDCPIAEPAQGFIRRQGTGWSNPSHAYQNKEEPIVSFCWTGRGKATRCRKHVKEEALFQQQQGKPFSAKSLKEF